MKVELAQLWDCTTPRSFSCGVAALTELEVDLVAADHPDTSLDTAVVPVAADGTAVAELTLPPDAVGTFLVIQDTIVLDTITAR